MNTIKLKEVAKNVRIDVIEALAAAKSGHPGGSLSVTDILTVLYFDKMNIDPKNPKMEDPEMREDEIARVIDLCNAYRQA
mgnify:CR=1 FL=1